MWHSAMVPHAGPDSRIFREVTQVGEAVARLGELAGSTVTAPVAVLHDSDAWWALSMDGLPSPDLDCHAELGRAHRALWDAGVTVDFAHPEHELGRYPLVIAPALFLMSDAGAENLRRYVAGGGTLLVQHASGFVDERLHARLGGYPAAPLCEALGIRVEEYRPLRRAERIALSDGSHSTVWSESLRAEGAETLATYTHGMLTDSPALTRHRFGTGQGWYLSTRLEETDYCALVRRMLKEAGVEPELPGLPPGVEAVTRHAPDGRRWHVLINHRTATLHCRSPPTTCSPAPSHTKCRPVAARCCASPRGEPPALDRQFAQGALGGSSKRVRLWHELRPTRSVQEGRGRRDAGQAPCRQRSQRKRLPTHTVRQYVRRPPTPTARHDGQAADRSSDQPR
jgi:beta-galactosidase